MEIKLSNMSKINTLFSTFQGAMYFNHLVFNANKHSREGAKILYNQEILSRLCTKDLEEKILKLDLIVDPFILLQMYKGQYSPEKLHNFPKNKGHRRQIIRDKILCMKINNSSNVIILGYLFNEELLDDE